jgi:tetratricopeptide (TPR) repeat protein
VSYCHADEDWKIRVVGHLKTLGNAVEVWHDRDIAKGDNWDPEIQGAMDRAAVALLLVSKDFLSSTFIQEREVPYLLDRRKNAGLRVIPLFVRPCAWQLATWLSEIQGDPKDAKALSEHTEAEADKALTALVLDVAARLGNRSTGGSPKAVASGSILPPQLDLGRLPVAGPLLIGRETEMARLDAAWQDPATHVLVLVAFGGMGKSALVSHWMDSMAAAGWRDAQRVLEWSFYRQGTQERVASAEPFLNHALAFFGDPDPPTGSPHERGQRLAGLVRKEKTLLVLDGIEPLQQPPGPLVGRLKDPGLAALLRSLAGGNPGLCVVTTRERIADLNGFSTSAPQEPLETLSPEAGAQLLWELGVEGKESELRSASKEFGSHALTLTLLGTYLKDICQGDVRRRREVPILDENADETGHARRVIASYSEALETPEIEVLRLIGLFDRLARPEHIKALRAEPFIEGLTEAIGVGKEERFRKAVARLRKARLVTEGGEELDAHPLVRVYFKEDMEKNHPEAWRAGNLRLYEHLQTEAPNLPDTLEAMEPLFAAVLHGCRAGRHQEAFDGVYRRRIQRESEFYSKRKLGALGSELTALSGFFDQPWVRPSAGLSEADQGFVLNEAGINLCSLGRLAEAVQPMQASLDVDIERNEWVGAAISANNVSELTLTLGEVERALAFAKQSVDLADRSGDSFVRLYNRSTLADALHQSGRWKDSSKVLREAEAMQAEWQPGYPRLYSFQGYRYCGLLLSRGEAEDGAGPDVFAADPEVVRRLREACLEVRVRAAEALKIVLSGSRNLQDVGLNHLSLGRSHLGLALTAAPGEQAEASFAQAAEHLDRAVEGLRHAGTEHFLPWGLLAQATLRRFRNNLAGAEADLYEALEIAERGSMRLHECDAHLEWARLCRQRGEREEAERHLAAARRIVKETGYGRRAREVAWLERHGP